MRDEGLGVFFQDLLVQGLSKQHNYADTFADALLETFGLKIVKSMIRRILHRPAAVVTNIIQGFTGLVLPGEMVLVLGRPGSGTTTLLRALANQPRSETNIIGEISYDGIMPAVVSKNHPGQVIFNDEGCASKSMQLPHC